MGYFFPLQPSPFIRPKNPDELFTLLESDVKGNYPIYSIIFFRDLFDQILDEIYFGIQNGTIKQPMADEDWLFELSWNFLTFVQEYIDC